MTARNDQHLHGAMTTWAASAAWAFTLGHWILGIVATAMAIAFLVAMMVQG